ncbi:MAG TPA: hypothetical protein VLS91_05435 [Acidimicrobiales bacterium]|nr:hypothetical protein [Acidimicrobiales bacterium]
MRISRLTTYLGGASLLVALALPVGTASGSSIPVISDASLAASFTTLGGASPLPTSKTVSHFWSSSVDPANGVTYGYNMVGADPATCSGASCTTTVNVDITPINLIVDGMSFPVEPAGATSRTSDVLNATLASPVFAKNDYASTPAATVAGNWPNLPQLVKGKGGKLLPAMKGQALQLEDATMRAQFNHQGASDPYHVLLNPVVGSPITITVPGNEGTLLQSGRGVVFADVHYNWWVSEINSLITSANSTDLPLYLTDNLMLYEGNSVYNCCVIGFHGATSSANGNGNQGVQTYAWASWVQPGLYSRANGGTDWALQDIHALSHEIAEWADDPFVNNSVQPWLTPTAPQYGCTGYLETGDPVVAIGFAMGSNSFQQGANPDGSTSADGYYHPEDEALLPWFMRLDPSPAAPTQTSTSYVGRYTLMGTLNPFPGFRQPATGC